MIVWINGTHGAGKTTTAALLQHLILDAHASSTWLHEAAEVRDTASLQPDQVAQQIADALHG